MLLEGLESTAKRRRMLISLGVEPDRVKLASRSRKGYWRMSQNSLVHFALNDAYLRTRGPEPPGLVGSFQIRRQSPALKAYL